MKEESLNFSPPPQVIKFPPIVGTLAFESILKENHKSSLSGPESIVFDLERSQWFGVFEISLLSLWIIELREKGISVIVRLPQKPSVRQFLWAYRFDRFLDENGVVKENNVELNITEKSPSLFRAPYYPLTFLSEQQFTRLLRELRTGNRLERVLQDVTDSEIVRTGAIRDIVLKELADNIQLHARGSSANIIMTKLGAQSYVNAGKWTKAILQEVTDLERPFFERLYGQSFLTLVIADKGGSIPNSLRDAYHGDSLLVNKEHNPTEADILEYAFLYHSTRRTIEERIGEIRGIISEDAAKFPPPTGLYRLKELVREFYGLLYVRSGSSIICYDFYNDHSREKPMFHKNVSGLESLARFDGTQYKIYFPVKISKRYHVARTFRLRLSEKLAPPQYKHLSTKPYGMQSLGADPDREAEGLFQLLQKLDGLSLSHQGKNITVLLDFHNQQLFSSKALHYLLFEAMQKQTTNFSVLAVNLQVDESQWREAFRGRGNHSRGALPLAVFNEGYDVHFFGPPPEEMQTLKEMVSIDGEQTVEMHQLGEKYDHIFTFNIRANRYDFIHQPAAIVQHLMEAVKSELAENLMSSSAEIFRREAKVLIPSRYYCEGYFEIYKLLANEDWNHLLREWFKYWLILLRPNFVISITGHVGQVLDKAIEEVKLLAGGISISHIKIGTPVREEELINLTLSNSVSKNHKGVVFSDVIGTTNTIKSVLQYIQHTDILKILTVVNAVEESDENLEYKGKIYEVESLVRHPLRYYKSLPPTWLYSQVLLVDPETHILIREEAKSEGPLWEDHGIRSYIVRQRDEEIEILINDFLESCVIPLRSYIEGHLTMGDKHMLYMFNVPSLLANHLDDIASIIRDDVNKNLTRSTSYEAISHTVYLTFNPGMDVMAMRVSADYLGAEPMPIDESQFYSPFDQEYGFRDLGAVILLDDAFISGDSLLRAYDIAERKGAKLILAYVLVKRGSEYQARRLEKITRFGSAEVQARYLADVELPIYTGQDCPICKRSLELLKLKEKLPKDELLENHINWEIGRAAPLPVDLLFTEERFETTDDQSDERLRMRWKLELAKRKPGPRKELATLVRRFNHSPDDTKYYFQVLCLFQILAREKHTFLFDSRVRDDIFYFAHDIVTACRWMMENAAKLTIDALGAALTVSLVFDEDHFIGNLFKLYDSTLRERDKFAQVTMHTFLSRRAHEYPGMIANVLEKLLEVGGSTPIIQTVDSLWRHWRDEEERAVERRTLRLKWFKEVTGGVLHEIGHLRENVEAAVIAEPLDFTQVTTDWLAFSENIIRIIPLIRGCIGINATRELQDKMGSKIAALEFQLRQARGILSSDGTSKLTDAEALRAATLLKQCGDRIYELIYVVPDNISFLLAKLKTNVKTVASRIIQQQQKDLRPAGIKVEKEFRKGACLVFGEEVYIGQIFQNLIENVCKYSKGGRLKIGARVHDNGERVDLIFLDDGRGIQDLGNRGHGLEVVIKNAKYYCGEFNIDNLCVDDYEYAEGFRTKAIVTLPYFRGRDDDD